MTIYDSLLNRVERLAKHIGRTDEIVAHMQQQEYDLRHARDGAVRELQQVKADRDETEAKRKMLHEAITQMFAELSQAAANFWPDHEPGTVAIHTLTGEIQRLREALRTANGRVDLANLSKLSLSEKNANFEAQVNKLKKQLAEAERDSRLGEALQDSMRQNQEIERLRAFVGKVRGILPMNEFNSDKLLWIQAALAEHDKRPTHTTEPAPVAEPAPCHELERLRRFVGGVEGALSAFQSISPDTCCDQIARYLSELEDSQPAPVAEPIDGEGGK